MNVCKNCNSKYQGNFCNNCGQKNTVGRFTFKNIFSEAFHAFTHADKSFLVTLKKVLQNPGKVAYEYIVECRRKKYFNPFTFFLILTAIAAFLGNKELTLNEAVFHDDNEYGRLFNLYSKVLSLATIPVLAFMLWVTNYHKNGLRYSEYTVFAMILLSVLSVLDIFTSSINIFLLLAFKINFSAGNHRVIALVIIILMAYANYNFHKKMFKNPWFRSLLSGVLVCVVQVAISIFVIWAVLRNFDGLGNFTMYGISNR